VVLERQLVLLARLANISRIPAARFAIFVHLESILSAQPVSSVSSVHGAPLVPWEQHHALNHSAGLYPLSIVAMTLLLRLVGL